MKSHARLIVEHHDRNGPVIATDTLHAPSVAELEAFMKEVGPKATSYLQRKNALDLMEMLGLSHANA